MDLETRIAESVQRPDSLQWAGKDAGSNPAACLDQPPLALAAAMRLHRYVQTQFNPNSEQSIAAADALYRAALFAIRERDAHPTR